jgi:hypothetical protein
MTEKTINERDMSQLTCEFRAKAESLLSMCAARGLIMKPHSCVRTPWSQARLWRKSRTSLAVKRRIAELRAQDALFLASCIEDVGPQAGQIGKHVTWVIPGYSWHNWGEAIDCHWMADGSISWSVSKTVATKNGRQNGYRVYADLASAMGLYSGGLEWGKDWPHVHLQGYGSPSKVMSLGEVDAEMRKRWT